MDPAKSAMYACLLDFYGPLLTQKQSEIMHLRTEEDLSLSEIADAAGASRQAVNDSVRSAEARLTQLEEKLGLYKRYAAMSAAVQNAVEALQNGDTQKALSILIAIQQEGNYGL